jgi:hypothetical protein
MGDTNAAKGNRSVYHEQEGKLIGFPRQGLWVINFLTHLNQ